jgi:hypothetical protein
MAGEALKDTARENHHSHVNGTMIRIQGKKFSSFIHEFLSA